MLRAPYLALVIPIVLGWGMISVSAPTYDEPVHLAAGYSILMTGNYRRPSTGHPPFAEMWSALPLIAMNPSRFPQHPALSAGQVYEYADYFLHQNTVKAETLLNAARLWSLVSWNLILGFGVLLWCRRLSGVAGLRAGSWLFAFCTPLFSNAALVTTDAASAALFFTTFLILSGGAQSWRWPAAGICAGGAMAAKFNMIIIFPLAAVLLLADHHARRKRGEKPPSLIAPLLIMALAAGAALAAIYRVSSLGAYLEGLRYTFRLMEEGRSAFFFGTHSTEGWLLYFPAALFVKTPIPLMIASATGLILAFKSPDSARFWVVAPPLAYFLATFFSKIQIGYRHMLPVYPFLVILGSSAAAWAWQKSARGRALCLALAVWLAVTVARVHPHHLAYFNELAGGPQRGYQLLVDSNLDWGQGLKELGIELRRRGSPVVALSYFGSGDPSYFGIRYIPVGFISNVKREGLKEKLDPRQVLFAVSATNLQATYYGDKTFFDWLKSRTPVFIAGHSIFLYDLTSDPEGSRHLFEILRGLGYDQAR